MGVEKPLILAAKASATKRAGFVFLLKKVYTSVIVTGKGKAAPKFKVSAIL